MVVIYWSTQMIFLEVRTDHRTQGNVERNQDNKKEFLAT